MPATITPSELETITAAKVVDARGSACPGPLLEAKKGIGSVSVGSILEIWSSDPVTKSDIGA
jgi:TusA-related sulfurtransferase